MALPKESDAGRTANHTRPPDCANPQLHEVGKWILEVSKGILFPFAPGAYDATQAMSDLVSQREAKPFWLRIRLPIGEQLIEVIPSKRQDDYCGIPMMPQPVYISSMPSLFVLPDGTVLCEPFPTVCTLAFRQLSSF